MSMMTMMASRCLLGALLPLSKNDHGSGLFRVVLAWWPCGPLLDYAKAWVGGQACYNLLALMVEDQCVG